MRFFFYSHDGMGLGHVRRNIAIASALQSALPKAQILVATSVDEVASLGLPPDVDTLKLPALRKIDNTQYCARRLTIPTGQMHNLRSAVLLEAVRNFAPDVVVVDKHPFGVNGELSGALDVAKHAGARLVFGLRDILDAPSVVEEEWAQEQIAERFCDYFDLVLVYGSPAVFDPIKEYRLGTEIAARTKYCGYVLGPTGHSGKELFPIVPKVKGAPTVLCTVGGGEDGFSVLEAFLRAASGARWNSVAVCGPLLPREQFQELRDLGAESGTQVQSFLPCVSDSFGAVDALVCMGGYNTLVEALALGRPVVCVPRVSPRSEQFLRAAAFQKRNLIDLIPPNKLNPALLSQRIDAALQLKPGVLAGRARAALELDGARNAAQHLLAVANQSLTDRASGTCMPLTA
jgi:predicted glycosyltransferase